MQEAVVLFGVYRRSLKGCDIRAEDGQLVIGKGMLKFHDFIYLMMEEERVDYQPKNRWQVLKAEFSEDETNLDYKAYRVRFFLDEEMELGENQIEMCRFYLREGSVLRVVIRILRICQRIRYDKSDLCYGGRCWGENTASGGG